MDLREALEQHLDVLWDVFISCLSGVLIYLHSRESYFEDYIFEKRDMGD